jgi:hypothetical protein
MFKTIIEVLHNGLDGVATTEGFIAHGGDDQDARIVQRVPKSPHGINIGRIKAVVLLGSGKYKQGEALVNSAPGRTLACM